MKRICICFLFTWECEIISPIAQLSGPAVLVQQEAYLLEHVPLDFLEACIQCRYILHHTRVLCIRLPSIYSQAKVQCTIMTQQHIRLTKITSSSETDNFVAVITITRSSSRHHTSTAPLPPSRRAPQHPCLVLSGIALSAPARLRDLPTQPRLRG